MEDSPLGKHKEEAKVGSEQEKELKKNDLFFQFQDIAADRSFAFGKNTTTTEHFQKIYESSFATHPERVLANIRLLHALNGHAGAIVRKICKQGKSPSSLYIQSLYDWSLRLSKSDIVDDTILLQEPPETLVGASSSASELYEKLLFDEKNPEISQQGAEAVVIDVCRKVLSLPEGKVKKWIDLVPHVFNARNPAMVFTELFKEVGYLPKDLTTRAAFKKVPFTSLVACVNALRSLEEGQYGDIAKYERSRLLNAMIREGHISSLQEKAGAVTMDSNGVFINAAGLHTHIPFGLLDETSIDVLKYDKLLSPDDVLEVAIRGSDENNYCHKKEALEAAQFDIFRKAMAEYGKPHDQSYLEKDESKNGKFWFEKYQSDLALYEKRKVMTPAECVQDDFSLYYLHKYVDPPHGLN